VFSIVITEKGGAQRQLDFEGAEIGIGRLEDNDLCLPKNNVSKYHARLVYKDERYVIVDQKSTNGTYVNGRRISAPMVVRKGDKVYIGDFILTLAAAGGGDGIAAREFRPVLGREFRGPTVPTPTRTQDLTRTSSDRPLEPAPPARPTMAPPAPPPSAAGKTFPTASVPPAPPQPDAEEAPPARSSSVPPPRTPSGPPPLPRPAPGQPPTAAGSSTAPRASEPPAHLEAAMPPATEQPRPAPPQRAGTARAPLKPSAPWSSDNAPAGPAGLTSPAVLAPSIRLQGALAMLMERLATHMNVARGEESAFPSEQQQTLERLIDELADEGALGPDLDRRFLREAAMSEAVGLGPLDRLLANRSVREIVVDAPTRVLADLGGGLTSVSAFFSDDSAVLVAARRLLHRAGQKLDLSETAHEAQLPGGGRVQLLLPPLAAKGPVIAVRCPVRAQSAPDSLVTDGVLSTDMLALLRSRVQQRKNILVLGPLGAGVSTLVSMLTLLGPDHERVVSIEESPSASLLNTQTTPLSRKARPEAELSEFLRQASQLRYDRLVIDDVRPEDVLTVLAAAAASNGVLLGMHAPDPQVALTLLELFAQSTVRVHADGHGVRPLLAAALQLLVHLAPDATGARRVLGISELHQTEPGTLELRPLFRYDGKSFAAVEPRPSVPAS
jgi:pilus assembly protein CpaF